VQGEVEGGEVGVEEKERRVTVTQKIQSSHQEWMKVNLLSVGFVNAGRRRNDAVYWCHAVS
jgi:hypothetical protein